MNEKRLDIQGLRAVAVVLVILNHLIGWPTGGFAGVDIFFVISGYLITGLLLREQQMTGRISLRRFYTRRAKRILPAALTVLIVTVAGSYFLFPRQRANGILVDGFWATIFGSNWRSIATGTDYMHATDAISPLQHFWSLSVEEQFYLFVPIALVLSFALAQRSPRVIIGTVIALLTAGSLAFAIWETGVNPTSAYFSTWSRVWELGAGALLALGIARIRLAPMFLLKASTWSGLLLLAAGAVLITGSTPFPGPWALIPIIGTVLVIIGGSRTAGPSVLTNPVATYIGTVSYSLYLWHLPVIVFISALLPQRGPVFVGVCVILISALAILSYHWIESPLRAAKWTKWKRPGRPSVTKAIALPALLILVIGSGIVAVQYGSPAVAQSASIEGLTVGGARSSSLAAERLADIETSMAATSWPDLEPAIDEIDEGSRAPEWVEDGCLARESNNTLSPEENASRCVYGNLTSSQTLALVGDSIAISYLPAIRTALEEDWRIEVFTMSQCPAVDVKMLFDGDPGSICTDFRKWTADQINAESPDLVVLASGPGSIGKLASGNTGDEAVSEWTKGAARTFETYKDQTVVSLDAPPPMNKLDECAIIGSSPKDCVSGVSEQFVDLSAGIRSAAAGYPNVAVPPTINWFCNENGLCPSFVGKFPTVVDGNHLGHTAAQSLAPLVKETLLRALQTIDR